MSRWGSSKTDSASSFSLAFVPSTALVLPFSYCFHLNVLLSTDGRTSRRDDPRLPTPDSPRRSGDYQSSRRHNRGDSPRREGGHDDSRSSTGGSIKGKERERERDRGDYSDKKSSSRAAGYGDSKGRNHSRDRGRDYEEIDRTRSRDYKSSSNNDSKQRNWKKDNSIGGYGKGKAHHAAFTPPRNGSSNSASITKDERSGRSRRKRSRSISDISTSPRSPDDRRRRKRSPSRSRERDDDLSDSGGSSYRRSRKKEKGNGIGGGSGSASTSSWRDRDRDRRGNSRTLSTSPVPDRPSATSRNKYQARDDIEKARAQVRERDAAVAREKKQLESLQKLKEGEKSNHQDTRDESSSIQSPPHQVLPSSDGQGKVLQRKGSFTNTNLTSSNNNTTTNQQGFTGPSQPRGTGGWTVIRESLSAGPESNEDSQQAQVMDEPISREDTPMIPSNGNGIINSIQKDSEMSTTDVPKEEAPSDAMLAAMAAAGMIDPNQSPTKNQVQEFESNQIATPTIEDSNVILTPPRSPARALPTEGYEKLSLVGEGTYGQVFKARAEASGTLVALKKIRMESEKDGFPVTALREIKLLQSLKHENVVRLHEMMVSKGKCSFLKHSKSERLCFLTFTSLSFPSRYRFLLHGL